MTSAAATANLRRSSRARSRPRPSLSALPGDPRFKSGMTREQLILLKPNTSHGAALRCLGYELPRSKTKVTYRRKPHRFTKRQMQQILLSEGLTAGAALRELGWEADDAAIMVEYNPPVKKTPQPLSAFFTNRLAFGDMDIDVDGMEIEEDDGGPIS